MKAGVKGVNPSFVKENLDERTENAVAVIEVMKEMMP